MPCIMLTGTFWKVQRLSERSRTQVSSKHRASHRDGDIVWPTWEHVEGMWKRYTRNISDKVLVPM
jgi:hypothetical protein